VLVSQAFFAVVADQDFVHWYHDTSGCNHNSPPTTKVFGLTSIGLMGQEKKLVNKFLPVLCLLVDVFNGSW
jgi:hypothetical protein